MMRRRQHQRISLVAFSQRFPAKGGGGGDAEHNLDWDALGAGDL
jgi:hypothetical protein|tara:strand:+ start:1446 stop:1577 length:132 start_codon:yes stop_codon:yes gene_type:complete